MSRQVSCKEAADLLKSWDHIRVLSHRNPDGDTLGSASGLLRCLVKLGKTVSFACADPIPEKFSYLFQGIPLSQEEPVHIVSVDVADPSLLGSLQETYGGKIDLAIDHHSTHVPVGEAEWVEGDSAANAELICLLAQELGVDLEEPEATCLYTGITTDTGCFRYQNVTPRTFRLAAKLLELGAKAAWVNRLMFETKSREMLLAERMVMDSIRFTANGLCALVTLPKSIYEETGLSEGELDGVAALPRQIQGVVLGITLKERDGEIKVSLRTNPPANAAQLCGRFGGGGHAGAAGCSFFGCTMEEAAQKILEEGERYLRELSLL